MFILNLKDRRCHKWYATILFLFLSVSLGFAQDVEVSGTVTDVQNGTPIPGVSVFAKNTSIGTSTDFDGNYTLSVPEDAVLVFSYIGFNTQEIPVGDGSVINVRLEESLEQLSEVVVIGYGVQKKELVTGANLQVEGESLEKQNTTNALQALQGQAAGVQITSTTGQPGGGINVNIRGLGSTGNNAPLYIVDGVQTGDITYLNNADIENISVLKDAASAAIYGAQASNGVILVTTKKGKSGRSQITFDSFYGVQTLAKEHDLLNAREYMTILNESAINSAQPRFFSEEEINEAQDGTNWLDEAISTAYTENYTIGITGGNDKSNYSSSISYLNQEGIVGGKDLSYYERYNFRFNSEHKLYEDIITFGENLSLAWINNNGIAVGNTYNNSLRGAFQANPLLPIYDADGNYFSTVGQTDPWLQNQTNPYAAMVYSNQNENSSQKLLGNVYFDFALAENLNFRSSLGVDYYANQGHSFSPIYTLSANSQRLFSEVFQSQSQGKTLIWDNILTYSFDLGEAHNFESMIGTSSFKHDGTWMNGSNSQLVFDDLKHAWLSNATNTDGAQISLNGGPNVVIKRMSYFGRLQYNFKEKYLFNATIRADGTSQFASGNRWGYFPSFSAGWVVTNESFMEDRGSWLNQFKLRASWGQVGNQNVGNFQYLAPISFNNVNYIFGNEEGADALVNGAYPSRLANPDLKWETSEQLDLGFDARLFDYKLNIGFDYYHKTTKDWLIQAPVLATAGAEGPWINGGDVTNKGVELSLNFSDSIGDDFNYGFTLNGAFNENIVGEIPTEDGIIHGAPNQIWNNSPEFYRAEDGHALGYFWGYKTAGVFQNQEEINSYGIQPDALPGDIKYVDITGDGQITEADKTDIGDPNPNWTYGLSFNADYKGFDFFVQTNGVGGNQIVQVYRDPGSQVQNWSAEFLDRWHGEGTSNSVPRITLDGRNFSEFSDYYVEDGDFFRISNVSLGYDLVKSMKKDFLFSQFRLYFTVQNLYTFTKYSGMDPEVGYGISTDDYNFSSGIDVGYYPRPRTYMMGLNVKF